MRTNSPITNLWINETDTDGFNRSVGLATIVENSTVLVRAANGTAMDLKVDGPPVDNGTWWTLPVTVLSGSVTKGARTQLNFISLSGGNLPPGGDEGEVLTKLSDDDGDAGWVVPTGGGGGGDGGWPLVVKDTEPTAADYGEDEIPLNAVWIQSS